MPAPTVLDVVRLSTRYLADRGVDSARLDAELLAAHSLGLRRLDLYLQFDRPLAEAELTPLRTLLRRRARGEPVAYLVGEREFFGRPFRVGPGVLVPRPETEALVERTLRWARERSGPQGDGLRLADIGTGSGCIAITLAAELRGARVAASDVSAAAVNTATANAEQIEVAERVAVVEGSWGSPLAGHEPFDAVVSNPPYVASGELDGLMRDVRDFEPRLALDGGPEGLDAYRALLADLPRLRGPGALVALEVDPRRAGAVAAMAGERWPGAAVEVSRDLAGLDRVVEAVLPG